MLFCFGSKSCPRGSFETKNSGIDAESARESENTIRTIRKSLNYIKIKVKQKNLKICLRSAQKMLLRPQKRSKGISWDENGWGRRRKLRGTKYGKHVLINKNLGWAPIMCCWGARKSLGKSFLVVICFAFNFN